MLFVPGGVPFLRLGELWVDGPSTVSPTTGGAAPGRQTSVYVTTVDKEQTVVTLGFRRPGELR